MPIVAVSEEKALKKLNEALSLAKNELGIVIGQKREDKCFIIHLSPLPRLNISCSTNEEGSVVNNDANHSNCMNAFSESEVINHARQINRMLPGGIDILGLYLTCPVAELNNSQNLEKLRVILTGLHKATSKYYLGVAEPDLEKILLHGCTQSSKTGIKVLDLSEPGSSLVSGTLKVQPTKWIEIDYNYSLSYQIYLPKERSTLPIYKSVMPSFHAWAKLVAESVITLDGKLYNPDDLLDKEQEDTPVKKKSRGSRGLVEMQPPKIMNAMLLEPCKCPIKVAEIQESSGSLTFQGVIIGRAFVHGKATAFEAFDALRKDLLRSLVSRWEMHCDSLVEEPLSAAAENVLHEPPRRVFLEGGGLPISLCDYLFPGETLTDTCQSAKEVLDIDISPDHVDDSLEIWADTTELMGSVPEGDLSGETHVPDKARASHGYINTFHLICAVVISFVSVAIAYLVVTKSKLIT